MCVCVCLVFFSSLFKWTHFFYHGFSISYNFFCSSLLSIPSTHMLVYACGTSFEIFELISRMANEKEIYGRWKWVWCDARKCFVIGRLSMSSANVSANAIWMNEKQTHREVEWRNIDSKARERIFHKIPHSCQQSKDSFSIARLFFLSLSLSNRVCICRCCAREMKIGK